MQEGCSIKGCRGKVPIECCARINAVKFDNIYYYQANKKTLQLQPLGTLRLS